MFRVDWRQKPCLLTGDSDENHARRRCRACKMVYARNYRATPRGQAQESARWSQRSRTPLAFAKTEVFKAVRSGIIEKAALFYCADCQNKASVYDHRDYLKPLEVEPVCRSCNHKRGKGLNREVH